MGEGSGRDPVLADTITRLPPEAAGAVVISASHGGLYPGFLAAKAGVRAVVLNDAGIGRDGAGIASLAYLEALGIAAATLSHLTCRIGDTADALARGRISHANALARACGLRPGLACREAAGLLRRAPVPTGRREPPPVGEGRAVLPAGRRPIVLLDSAAAVGPGDAGAVVVTGSHGGLVGGDPAAALRTEAFAAAFSDAGIGIEGAGTTRLPALDRRGIAAVTVAAESARIGDGRSIFEDGIVSCLNDSAARLGARAGLPLRALALAWADRP